MKHVFHGFYLLLLAVVCAACLTACSESAPEGATRYTLTYYVRPDATQSVPVIVENGELYFTVPTRRGYAFDGLYDAADGGVQIVNASGELTLPITKNMTLWAQWTPNTYTAVFDPAAGQLVSSADAQRAFVYGAAIDALPLPVREGYDFVGWYCAGQAVSDALGRPLAGKEIFLFESYPTEADGRVQLRAEWKLRQLTVTFDYNDGSYRTRTVKVNYGDTLYLSSLPKWEEEGHETKGWARVSGSSALISEDLHNIREDITLYAVWHRFKDVTLIEHGSTKRTVRLYEDASQPMPTPSRYGYVFEGWYTTTYFAGNPTEHLVYATASDTYFARWELLTYRVTYDGNGATAGTVAEDVVRSEENKQPLAGNMYIRTGHTFLGWSTSRDGTQARWQDGETVGYLPDAADGGLTLYAVWQANTYTVTIQTNYDADKAEPYCMLRPTVSATSMQVTYGTSYCLPVPTMDTEYYRFIGYFTKPESGTQITDKDGNALARWGSTENVTLYAHWRQVKDGYTYIATVNGLKKLNGSSGSFMLIRDITDVGSIGMMESFSGVFDGNGHTLSGWTYTQSTVGKIGLFGINYGTIRNLNLQGFTITNYDPDVSGTLYAGLLCGENQGTVELVVVTEGTMRLDVASMGYNVNSTVYAGFICGNNTGTVRKSGVRTGCYMQVYVGTQYQHAEAYCGGVAGTCLGGVMTDVFSSGGTIKAQAKADVQRGFLGIETGHGAPRVRVGGVIGYAANATVTRALGHDNALVAQATRDCDCDTNIDWRMGSLIGYRESATMLQCYSEAGDTLFGWASDSSGAGMRSTGSIQLHGLPAEFAANGWVQAYGVPCFVVQ